MAIYKPARDFPWNNQGTVGKIAPFPPCGEIHTDNKHAKEYVGGIYIREGKIYFEPNLDNDASICIGNGVDIDSNIIKKEIVKKQLKK